MMLQLVEGSVQKTKYIIIYSAENNLILPCLNYHLHFINFQLQYVAKFVYISNGSVSN